MESTSPGEGNAAPARWLWLAMTIGVAWGLAILVAQSPPPLKRLILLPAGYGLVCSLIAGLGWQYFVDAPPGLGSRWLVTLLAISGLMYSSYLSYQSFRQECLNAARNPNNLMGIQFLELDPEMQNSERLAELKALQNPTFDMYLRHRTRQLGKWPHWAALTFWIVELLVAGLVVRLVFPMAAGESSASVSGTEKTVI